MERAACLRLGASAVFAVVFLLIAQLSYAQTDDEGWQLSIGPHLWLANVNGDATIRGQQFDIDIDFDDIIDNAEGALMLRIEAQKGRFGLFLQPNYLKLSKDAERVVANLEVKFFMVEFGGFYELARFGQDPATPTTVDFLVGGRYWGLTTDLTVDDPVLGSGEREADRDLIDPTVGLRLKTFLVDRVKFSVWGDVGGFDVSDNSSDFSWQAAGTLSYIISEKFDIFAGYRAIRIETDDDNDIGTTDELNLTFQGPVIGLNSHW